MRGRLARSAALALIVLLTIEGAAAHLAHDHGCRAGGEPAGTCGHAHRHGPPAIPGGAVESQGDACGGDCAACCYLAQRVFAYTDGQGPDGEATVQLFRPLPIGFYQVGSSLPDRARAPPHVG